MKYLLTYIFGFILFVGSMIIYFLSFPLNFLWQFRWKTTFTPYNKNWRRYRHKQMNEVQIAWEYYLGKN